MEIRILDSFSNHKTFKIDAYYTYDYYTIRVNKDLDLKEKQHLIANMIERIYTDKDFLAIDIKQAKAQMCTDCHRKLNDCRCPSIHITNEPDNTNIFYTTLNASN